MKLPTARLFIVFAVALLTLAPTGRTQTTPELTTLYSFRATDGNGNNSDGAQPTAALVQGGDGNFYGTTKGGGNSGDGTVFKITPDGTLTNLYIFSATDNDGDNADGANPVAGLVLGSDGNFYGTTQLGGTNGKGTVFSITPAGALTTIHSFSPTDGNGLNGDGAYPVAALVQGGDGNFYGTAQLGGTSGSGTVFQITPTGVVTTLHTFSAVDGSNGNADGANPVAGLVLGSDGNFYGTTTAGGTGPTGGFGTVFSITPDGTLTNLYSFVGDTDGAAPQATLVQGSDGNFYGTTTSGVSGAGTIFSITPAGKLTTLHTFSDDGQNGTFFESALVEGSDGNFYGTATDDGSKTEDTIFSITPAGTLTTLYTFSGSDGQRPQAALVRGQDGNFYGTTELGGGADSGTVFRLTLHPAFFAGETELDNGVYYLDFPNGNIFGYYSYLDDPHYIFHDDLGYEYVFDADDGNAGVYLYDFASSDFFYTSPTFSFPYLYDFGLNSVVYYYPDPDNPGRYNTDGVRYFYVFNTGQIISK